eukprot:768651-Hanusia_phi.AAC.1
MASQSSLVHARVRYFEERMRAGGWEEEDESKVKSMVDQDILSPGLVRNAKRRLRKEEGEGEEEKGEEREEPTWKKRRSVNGNEDKENNVSSTNVKEKQESKKTMSDEFVCQISFNEEQHEEVSDTQKEMKTEEVEEEDKKTDTKATLPSVVTWTIHSWGSHGELNAMSDKDHDESFGSPRMREFFLFVLVSQAKVLTTPLPLRKVQDDLDEEFRPL